MNTGGAYPGENVEADWTRNLFRVCAGTGD